MYFATVSCSQSFSTKSKPSHLSALCGSGEGAGTALSGDGSESSGALDALSVCLRLLDGISRFRGEYTQLAEKLHALYYDLEDAAYTLRDYRNDFSFEPGMLDEIETRLELISTLKRKYGANIAEILAYRDKSVEELDLISNAEERREQLFAEYADQKRGVCNSIKVWYSIPVHASL